MPVVMLKPQPISSVFSRRMHNAVKASAGRGPVEVSAERKNGARPSTEIDHKTPIRS